MGFDCCCFRLCCCASRDSCSGSCHLPSSLHGDALPSASCSCCSSQLGAISQALQDYELVGSCCTDLHLQRVQRELRSANRRQRSTVESMELSLSQAQQALLVEAFSLTCWQDQKNLVSNASRSSCARKPGLQQ